MFLLVGWLHREVRRPRGRRCNDVAGIFPARDALIRLVGAVLAKRHGEWTDTRRYQGVDASSAAAASTRSGHLTGEVARTRHYRL